MSKKKYTVSEFDRDPRYVVLESAGGHKALIPKEPLTIPEQEDLASTLRHYRWMHENQVRTIQEQAAIIQRVQELADRLDREWRPLCAHLIQQALRGDT